MTVTVVSPQQTVTLVSTGGAQGLDAYQVAVFQGFAGTRAEWLASLRGADGAPGPAGADGAPGPPGDPQNIQTLFYAPQGVAGPLPLEAQAGGTISIAEIFYSLNGRRLALGDDVTAALNLAFAIVRGEAGVNPSVNCGRTTYRGLARLIIMGVVGGRFIISDTIDQSSLRHEASIRVDLQGCTIIARTPGKICWWAIGTRYCTWSHGAVMADALVGPARIGFIHGRSNVPAGDGHYQAAANQVFENFHVYGSYTHACLTSLAGEQTVYRDCKWVNEISDDNSFVFVGTCRNVFDIQQAGLVAAAQPVATESYNAPLFENCEFRHRGAQYAVNGTTRQGGRACVWLDGVKGPKFVNAYVLAANCEHHIELETATNAIIYDFDFQGHFEGDTTPFSVKLVSTDSLAWEGISIVDYLPQLFPKTPGGPTALLNLEKTKNNIIGFIFKGEIPNQLVWGEDPANGSGASRVSMQNAVIIDREPGNHPGKINVNTLLRFSGEVTTQDVQNAPDGVGGVFYELKTPTYRGLVRGHQSVTISNGQLNPSALYAGVVRALGQNNADDDLDYIVGVTSWRTGSELHIHAFGQNITLRHLVDPNVNGCLYLRGLADRAIGPFGNARFRLRRGGGPVTTVAANSPTYWWEEI